MMQVAFQEKEIERFLQEQLKFIFQADTQAKKIAGMYPEYGGFWNMK